MAQRSHLSVVRPDDASPPLLPPSVELEQLPRAMIDIDWLCNSRFRRKATDAQMIAAVTLRAASYHEVPAGSLPDDDEELAFLAKIKADTRWSDVKAVALEGWTLCSDGRWYNTDLAKLVLHSWIVRLADRRRSAAGVARRRKKVFDASEIDRDIAAAVAALGSIDPHAPILQNYRTDQADVGQDTAAVTSGPTSGPTPGPTSGATKVSEAKRSQNSSPDLRSGDSRISDEGEEEIVEGEVLPPLAVVATKGREPPGPWPADWFACFRAGYPRKKSWGAAEKVLQRYRKAGNIAFEAIMAGVERLVAAGGDPQYVPYPATWLAARGWEDEPDPAPGIVARPSGRSIGAGQLSALRGIFEDGNQGRTR